MNWSDFDGKLVGVQLSALWLYMTNHNGMPEPMTMSTPQGDVPLQVPFVTGKILAVDEDWITLRWKDERSNPHSQMITKLRLKDVFSITAVESENRIIT